MVICYRDTDQMAQFQAIGNVLGANGHPNDVPFVCEFWWESYRLGTMSTMSPPPKKNPISAISSVFLLFVIHVSMSLARWLHALVEPIIQ